MVERRISFDAVKDVLNRQQHGVSLAMIGDVLEGAVGTFQDGRFDYGEERFVTFGRVDDRLYVAVWTMREDTVRAISLRKANAREQKRYGSGAARTLGRQPGLE